MGHSMDTIVIGNVATVTALCIMILKVMKYSLKNELSEKTFLSKKNSLKKTNSDKKSFQKFSEVWKFSQVQISSKVCVKNNEFCI